MTFFKKKVRRAKGQEGTLWDWFSRYIRLRDTHNGRCKCFTCWRSFHPKEMEAGHFVKRDRKSVKYHEKNCHAQCHWCNQPQDGNAGRYAVELDKRYGKGTAEMLIALGTRTGGIRPFEFKMLSDHYRKLANAEVERAGVQKWW
jgi:hypothetical protein